MKPVVAIAALLFIGLSCAKADSPIPPRTDALVIAPRYGTNVFLVSLPPESKTSGALSTGRTIAYRVEPDATFRKLYELATSIPDGSYVSHDGRLIVVVAGMLPGHAPQSEHDCVWLYRDGRLLKKYSVLDLVRSPAKVKKTVSHYIWLANPTGRTDEALAFLQTSTGYELQVRTIDGIEYSIDAETGRIFRQYDPANAK